MWNQTWAQKLYDVIMREKLLKDQVDVNIPCE
jgi:hypothetical protein